VEPRTHLGLARLLVTVRPQGRTARHAPPAVAEAARVDAARAAVAEAARVSSAQPPIAEAAPVDAAEPALPWRPHQRCQPEPQGGERQVLHHVQL
jgi:hypothetical protein